MVSEIFWNAGLTYDKQDFSTLFGKIWLKIIMIACLILHLASARHLGENILQKVRKSSKIGQDHKNMISAFT